MSIVLHLNYLFNLKVLKIVIDKKDFCSRKSLHFLINHEFSYSSPYSPASIFDTDEY